MSSTQFEAGPDECDTGVALTKAINAVLAEDELFPLSDMWWLTPAELAAQFERVNSGDRIVYGVGQLDYAREIVASAKDIHAATSRLFRQGKATLTKKHLGPGKAEYWLVKR